MRDAGKDQCEKKVAESRTTRMERETRISEGSNKRERDNDYQFLFLLLPSVG